MSIPDLAGSRLRQLATRPLKPVAWVPALAVVTVAAALWVLSPLTGTLPQEDGESCDLPPRRPFNGFDLTRATILSSEIRSGGPDRDDIPAIDEPKFVAPNEVNFLNSNDMVISLTIEGQTRAYPLRILIWHEIVNDVLNGHPIAVTYCPLCGAAMVFRRTLNGRTLSFGVSGLLYQSDMLMYDRESESLWSQLAMSAVSGQYAGTAMEWLPSETLSWSEWMTRFPAGQVLSIDTSARRDYNQSPYRGYEASPDTMFEVPNLRQELQPKEWVVGIIVEGVPKAYPLKSLPKGRTIRDLVSATHVELTRDEADQATARSQNPLGRTITAVRVYWFAWQAFYPNTELWKP